MTGLISKEDLKEWEDTNTSISTNISISISSNSLKGDHREDSLGEE